MIRRQNRKDPGQCGKNTRRALLGSLLLAAVTAAGNLHAQPVKGPQLPPPAKAHEPARPQLPAKPQQPAKPHPHGKPAQPGKPKEQPMTGITTPSGTQYWGIPYAEPPVGELRWKAPRLLAYIEGYQAVTPGLSCPQGPSPFGVASVTEDCLYLNVFQPKTGKGLQGQAKNPVMVWFHGGALTYGEGFTYDPQKLVEEGVLVVTVNYRLGALGYMAHPALSAENGGASGNYGLQDQMAALRWVQNNIHRFGGDPKRVTIFGESAGGLSVSALLTAPAAKGLFHRAIIQSGAYGMAQPTQQQWEQMGLGRAAAMGCTDQTASCLRSLSVEQILAQQDAGEVGWLPVVDGVTLPQTMVEAFAKGEFHRVPVIQGTTRDEYSLFTALSFELAGNPVTAANYVTAIAQLGIPAAVAPWVAAVYPPEAYTSPAAALTAVGTDSLFACNSLAATKVISRFVPTFAYEFNDRSAPQKLLPPVSFPYGAYHSSELQYLFGTGGRPHGELLNREQKKLSQAMVRYWTSFAKNGNPNQAGAPMWVRYGDKQQLMQSLSPVRPAPINNFAAVHHCDFWSVLREGT